MLQDFEKLVNRQDYGLKLFKNCQLPQTFKNYKLQYEIRLNSRNNLLRNTGSHVYG